MTDRLIAIIGNQGSFKTCLLTSLLDARAKLGRAIAANYHLNIPYTPMPFSKIATLDPGFVNIDFGVDELAVGADSYDFFATQARKISRFTLQLRKRGSYFYYTTQKFSLIPRRIRLETGKFYFMRDLDEDYSPADPRLSHRDICAGFAEITCCNQHLDILWQTNGRNIPHFDGKPYFGLYDDREMIWDDDEGEDNKPKSRKSKSVDSAESTLLKIRQLKALLAGE